VPRSPHKKVHEVCPWGVTTWADCDRAADNAKADWDAMQQVILIHKIALREQETGKAQGFKDKNLFDQLVRVFRGTQEDLTTDDGNPNVGPWALRLRAAVARYHAGDVPVYNLYQPPSRAGEGG